MSTIYQALLKLEESGQSGVLCTIISTQGSTPRHVGSKMLVLGNGDIVGTIGGGEVEYRVVSAALEVLNDKKPLILKYAMVDPEKGDPGVCGGKLEIFLEPILPKNKLVVIGGGHVGKEVAFLGQWLDFYVVVFDDRPEYSHPDAIPNAHEYHTGDVRDFFNNVEFNTFTYVVLTTRNVEIDLEILPLILDRDVAYVGVIGSKRRWLTTKEKLEEKGIPSEKIIQIFSPIGLDLKGETPREIALSIFAEIVMVQKHGNPVSISKAGKLLFQEQP